MSSKAQKRHGYPLPENEWEEETVTLCVTIPQGEEWLMAFKGQMYLLGKWWWWKRNPDRPKAASDAATNWRDKLIIEEDCGMSIDYEALKNAIKDGTYESMNDLAKQIVSGRTTNISVDDEGGVSDPTTEGSTEIPEDDPTTTTIDETQAAIYGGTISLVKGVESFLAKLDTYYGPTNGTPVTSASDTKFNMKALFPTDETAFDAAVDGYYTYRNTNGALNFIPVTANYLYIYCKGHNEIAWNRWVVDQSGYTQTRKAMILTLTETLLDEFWTSYFNTGVSVPSTVYLDASCVPSPTEEMQVIVLGTSYTTQTSWKPNHRLQVTMEGFWTDPADNDIHDSFWYKTVAGNPVSRISNMTMQLGTGVPKPTTNQVPYNTAHKYVFTIDTPSSSGALQIIITASGVFTGSSTTTNGVKVTVKDLGELAQ